MIPSRLLSLSLVTLIALRFPTGPVRAQAPEPKSVFGFLNFDAESGIEEKFLAVPDPKLAGQDLKFLSSEPHMAATPEDRRTADFVAQKFRAAGLETEIVPYRVLLNQPKVVKVEAYDPSGKLLLAGPTREHVDGDPAGDDPRVVMPFSASSGSGDVAGDVVYANYCRLEDYDQLASQHIDLHGKIVLCRYGSNFRGVKVYIAEQRGAAGVLLYSDPQEDGYYRGDPWPLGPWRPETGVQLGSVQYLFRYPGDPETPGVASTPDLPDSARVSPAASQPHIIAIPISYHDASPILAALKGPGVPQGWQGALPFRYHIGPGGVRVHLVSQQDYQRRLIWDVVATIRGSEDPDAWVIAGNHRDAWVYGAADPGSGSAAMLEAARGLGTLLREGWRPKRTILLCSWDAEEEGLIGSTEWAEQHAKSLENAVAYINTDIAASGPDFSASAVPSLKQFLRDLTRSVPSPIGGTVFEQWRIHSAGESTHRTSAMATLNPDEVRVGNLGSGSDYTPFLQRYGVPSTDIGSDGPYGVYHSAFDDYAWFIQNADPHFFYLQQMARVFGLEVLRMADADVLPYDYVTYAREIARYIEAARAQAKDAGPLSGSFFSNDALNFDAPLAAADRFLAAAEKIHDLQSAPTGDLTRLNSALRRTESALLTEAGLPNRPWYRHTIYAPGEYTGYAAVVIPGVTEAIEAKNPALAAQQLSVLTQALDRATQILDSAR